LNQWWCEERVSLSALETCAGAFSDLGFGRNVLLFFKIPPPCRQAGSKKHFFPSSLITTSRHLVETKVVFSFHAMI